MTSRRAWAKCLGLPLLALVFAQPACFTMMTWQDTRRHPVKASATAEEIEAYRLLDRYHQPAGIAIHRTPALDVLMEDAKLPADASWLVLRPAGHASTAAFLVALGVLTKPSADSYEGPSVCLRQDDAGNCSWLLHQTVWGTDARLDARRFLPGFRLRAGLWASYAFAAPLAAEPMHGQPDGIAERLHSVDFARELPFDTGYRPISRFLWTPVAFAGDVISAPWELIWFLQNR